MHIVYVSREYPPSLRAGGIASYLKIVAEGFAARGHQVTVIAANDDTRKSSDETINSVRVLKLAGGDFLIKSLESDAPYMSRFRFLTRFHSYRQKIRDTIVRLDSIDIIEVAEFGAEGLYLNNLDIPVVYRLHTPALLDHKKFALQKLSWSNMPYYLTARKELTLLKNNAKYITSCSTSLKDWSQRFLEIDPTKIKVIYNPLQPDFINDNQSINGTVNKDIVFFAGTICDWKGAGDLTEACYLLNGADVKVTLKMAGKSGSYGEAIKKKYESSSWLHVLGKLPQRELKDLYALSGVVCFPSWWENMPMVCIEAMAQGAVVIGSNSGGMSGAGNASKRPRPLKTWMRLRNIWRSLDLVYNRPGHKAVAAGSGKL